MVKERYTSSRGQDYYSINGHAYAEQGKDNGLVNFAMLKTIMLTEPLASGQRYAEILGLQAILMGGGQPMMQRIGDFRLGKRSKRETFNLDLYDFAPTLPGCTPGDISLAAPAKILRSIWKSMKLLDRACPKNAFFALLPESREFRQEFIGCNGDSSLGIFRFP